MRHCARYALALLSFCFVSTVVPRAQDTGSRLLGAASVARPHELGLFQRAKEFRQGLDEKGVAVGLTFVNDWSKNFRGGASTASFDRYSLDLTLMVDTKKSFGWNGGAASIRFKNHIGQSGGDYVGDAQGFSNIDDESRTRLYELWYEQRLATDRLRFKFGQIDANSEFAVVRTAGDFLNSSMGYSPTIMALPTYPEPKPAINVFMAPMTHYQVNAGLFRTGGSGKMLLFEGGRDWRISDREFGGRSSFGFWRLTGTVPCFDGDSLDGTQGFYAVAEQALWKKRESEKELVAFLQFARADGDVSRFTHHIGGGVVLHSPFAARPHDSIGMAATSVRFTDEPDAGYQYHTESAIEAYYKVGLGKFLGVAPDVQFIHHPGGLLSQRDALVLTPRLTLTF